MYDKIYFKCPNCDWGENVLGDGVLAVHVNESGEKCHMSNQFPLDRLSNQAILYLRGLNYLDNFIDIVGDRQVRIWIDGDCIMYQCEDYFGMRVPAHDLFRWVADRDAHNMIYYRRQELLKLLGKSE